MTFEELLTSALDQVFGARGLAFLAQDGEIVYQCTQRKVTNLDLLAAYHGIILAACQRHIADADIGHVKTLICHYEAGICLVRALNEGYLLIMALEANGNIGHALWVIEEISPHLNAEIS